MYFLELTFIQTFLLYYIIIKIIIITKIQIIFRWNTLHAYIYIYNIFYYLLIYIIFLIIYIIKDLI